MGFWGGSFLCEEAEAEDGGLREDAEVGVRAAGVDDEEKGDKARAEDAEVADNGLVPPNTLLPLPSPADGIALNRLSDQLSRSEDSACNDNRGGRAVNLFRFKLGFGGDSSCWVRVGDCN